MEKYSVEYLIMHENDVDWESISKDGDDWLSLVEIRLFRKRINWRNYLITHQNQVDTNILEIASKYFDDNVYEILASFGIATEDFILKHIDNFDIKKVIENCLLSEDAIFILRDYWKDIPDIYKIFKKAKYIDLDAPEYRQLRLYFETSD